MISQAVKRMGISYLWKLVFFSWTWTQAKNSYISERVHDMMSIKKRIRKSNLLKEFQSNVDGRGYKIPLTRIDTGKKEFLLWCLLGTKDIYKTTRMVYRLDAIDLNKTSFLLSSLFIIIIMLPATCNYLPWGSNNFGNMHRSYIICYLILKNFKTILPCI